MRILEKRCRKASGSALTFDNVLSRIQFTSGFWHACLVDAVLEVGWGRPVAATQPGQLSGFVYLSTGELMNLDSPYR